MRILFVCTGNTCRSPLAQAFMEDKLKKLNIDGIEVDSCGIYCIDGNPISQNSQAILLENKIEFTHLSRRINMDDVKNSDYIICMTEDQKKMLEEFVPKSNLYSMHDITNKGDILDPYGGSIDVYRETAHQINYAVDLIIKKLTE